MKKEIKEYELKRTNTRNRGYLIGITTGIISITCLLRLNYLIFKNSLMSAEMLLGIPLLFILFTVSIWFVSYFYSGKIKYIAIPKHYQVKTTKKGKKNR